MHSYPSFVNVQREDDHLQFRLPVSHPIYQTFDGSWPPIDPALYNSQFEPQNKLLSPDYTPFQQLHASFHVPASHIPENFTRAPPTPGWNVSADAYRDVRYNSPGGHFGGTLSESSSDYAISPEVARQQMSFTQNRYLSPSTDSHFTPQTWSENASFMLTPTSTPAGTQAPSIAMKELEFPTNPEFQLEVQDDDLRAQLPLNNPEELDLSDSIVALTTSNGAYTGLSAPSPYHSDSSTSSPAQEHDSDSDFDPKRRTSKLSAAGTRQMFNRSPRRTSSSSHTTLDVNNRIHKPSNSRSNQNKEKSKPRSPPHPDASQSSSSGKASKSFPCTFHAFGCPATFANKNEWKRHVTTQHLQLGFYRCDLGTCNPDNTMPPTQQSTSSSRGGRGHNKRRSASRSHSHPHASADSEDEIKIYNDFNRKDLFTQHCRRMHGPFRHLIDDTTTTNQTINARLRAQGRRPSPTGKPMCTKDDEATFEEELEDIRSRCWTQRRYAPTRSSCTFCGQIFEAATTSSGSTDGKAEERAWEERMEHLGRHYERDAHGSGSGHGNDGPCEEVDRHLMEWGLNEGVLGEASGVGCGVWLVGYEVPVPNANGLIDDDAERREGLWRRGPRRKVSSSVSASARVVATPVHPPSTTSIISSGSNGLGLAMGFEESDEDALAEDE